MGLIRNIKTSIDDKSSMSVASITMLASAFIGVVMGFVMCFVLVYDVTYDGKIDTDMGDLAMLLMASGTYILGSSAPKAFVDSKMKTRSWVENEKMEIEADEEGRAYRRCKRQEKSYDENNEENLETQEGNE